MASNIWQALVVGCAPAELRAALADRSDSYLPRRFHEMLGCRRVYTVTAGNTAGNTAGGELGAVLSLVRVYLLRVVRPARYRWPLHRHAF